MKTINKIVVIMTVLLSFTFTNTQAQTKNTKTETFKVYGNCGMCKKTIEKAANKNSAKAIWNEDSKALTVTYDSTKTNSTEILKRIADAGYDNDKFTAPDDVYKKLHHCCQYDRKSTEAPHGH